MTDATKPGGDVRLVITTCPDGGTGEAIVRTLVQERLAACGNIIADMRSIFWWQGRVDTEAECLVLLKTRASLLDQLARRLDELHPYDVPELLAMEVDRGAIAYLDWVVEETTSGS